jgi:hypothetical protein
MHRRAGYRPTRGAVWTSDRVVVPASEQQPRRARCETKIAATAPPSAGPSRPGCPLDRQLRAKGPAPDRRMHVSFDPLLIALAVDACWRGDRRRGRAWWGSMVRMWYDISLATDRLAPSPERCIDGHALGVEALVHRARLRQASSLSVLVLVDGLDRVRKHDF